MKSHKSLESIQSTQGASSSEATAITIKPDNCENQVLLASSEVSGRAKKLFRLMVLLLFIAVLILGRRSVPDNEVACVEDKVIDALKDINTFLNDPANHNLRDFAQILCSLLVDITFILTFGNWVINGTNGRLPLAMAAFYVTRALIQQIWFSPFPEGYYWEDPGVPSLVVPYGRGSDFFFSGHSGFMVICALEWHKLNVPKIRNFVILSGVYTVFILLAYRIHYSIDIFTGTFFAEWCFSKMDNNKDFIDALWTMVIVKVKKIWAERIGQAARFEQDQVELNHIDENQQENDNQITKLKIIIRTSHRRNRNI